MVTDSLGVCVQEERWYLWQSGLVERGHALIGLIPRVYAQVGMQGQHLQPLLFSRQTKNPDACKQRPMFYGGPHFSQVLLEQNKKYLPARFSPRSIILHPLPGRNRSYDDRNKFQCLGAHRTLPPWPPGATNPPLSLHSEYTF